MSWLFDTLVATGALIALVLVMRRPVARLFGPGIAYALWALPLLRLILPPLLLPGASGGSAAVTIIGDLPAAAPMAVADPAFTVPWTALGAVWLLGAVLFLGWRVAGYVAMRRRLLTGARPVGEAGAVRLVETPATAAPVAFGVRDKVVALPPGFMAREDRTARDLAIAHELEHHAARDLAVNLAVQPLLALHWFNPLAWAGWRALRRDQEAACDARVLAGRDAAIRARYAHLISDFARSPRLALAAPMACPISLGTGLGDKSIVHRLRSLTMTEPSSRRRLAGIALIAAAALALPATASIVYAAPQDAPVPPAPVVPPVPVAAPHAETRVVIVEHPGKDGQHGEPRFTRTVTRDGKTIVIRTDREISDADVEARLADIDRIVPVPPVPPVPPAPGAAPMPPTPPRVVIIRRTGPEGADMAAIERSCGEHDRAIRSEGGSPEKRQTVIMRFCGKDGAVWGEEARARAAEAMRRARDRVAADTRMSPEVRADVVRQLDQQIAEMSKAG